MSKHIPSSQTEYKQGLYKLQHPLKYIGNPDECYYRSSWELRFMKYCDLNTGVLKWGSEIHRITYIDFKGKQRTYIPDFYMETVKGTFIVEIKPEQETQEPIVPKGHISASKMRSLEYLSQTWTKNNHKWHFAKEWCQSRGFQFKIVTESSLFKINP